MLGKGYSSWGFSVFNPCELELERFNGFLKQTIAMQKAREKAKIDLLKIGKYYKACKRMSIKRSGNFQEVTKTKVFALLVFRNKAYIIKFFNQIKRLPAMSGVLMLGLAPFNALEFCRNDWDYLELKK